jgi:hypothetical protein
MSSPPNHPTTHSPDFFVFSVFSAHTHTGMVRFEIELCDESYPKEAEKINETVMGDLDDTSVFIVIHANGRSVQWLGDVAWKKGYVF